MSNAAPRRRAARFDEFGQHGDAHAHVRCEDDRDHAGVTFDLRLALVVEARGADDRRDAGARACRKMRRACPRAA